MSVEPIGPTVSPFHDDIGSVPPSVTPGGHLRAFADGDGPSFSDLIDVVNPLQHIPVVSTIYQQLTGDRQGAVAEVVGGALWGGPIGVVAALADLPVEDATGETMGGNVVALFRGDDKDTAVAQKDPSKNSAVAQSDAAPAAARPTVSTLPPAVATASIASPAASRATAAASPTLPASPTPADGPVVAGDYLIFGGGTGGSGADAAPTSLLPQAAEQRSSAPSTAAGSPAARPITLAQAAPTDSATTDQGPRRAGDFLVFGAGAPAAAALPETSDAPAPVAANAAAAQPAAASPTPAPAAGGQPRSFPVPQRRASISVPQSLPLPTTGPAAVPGSGRPSQAIGQSANAGSGFDGPGFVDAFNQAMDKYQKAARLGTITPPAGAPDAPAAASAPLN